MRYLILLVILVYSACSSGDDVPADLLPPAKMELVFYDMIMADERTTSRLVNDTLDNRRIAYSSEFAKVLSIHKVSQDDFSKSLRFYQSRPDLFKPIVDSMNAKTLRLMQNIGDRAQPIAPSNP